MSVCYPNESADYRQARESLLDREKDLRRQMEAVAQARRSLPPGGPVPEDYAFDGVGPDGSSVKVRLSELFADDSESVLLYQMMFPRFSSDDREDATSGETAKLTRQEQPCPSCTALLDQLNTAAHHFEAGGGRFAVVAKTSLENLQGLARDRGWTLRLLSAAGNTFKRDYLSEDENGEQLPLMTVFRRDPDGTIRHFWSSELMFAESDPGQDPRAVGPVEPFWNMFDLLPQGRPDFQEQLLYACCSA